MTSPLGLQGSALAQAQSRNSRVETDLGATSADMVETIMSLKDDSALRFRIGMLRPSKRWATLRSIAYEAIPRSRRLAPLLVLGPPQRDGHEELPDGHFDVGGVPEQPATFGGRRVCAWAGHSSHR
jgi:acyl carrier protein